MESIKVRIVEIGDRKFYMMQFRDPITGRTKTKSTGIERTGRKRERAEAEKVAGKWEAELREGRYCDPSKVTWQTFRERYESEVLSGLKATTDAKVFGVFNSVEEILNPQRLRDLTADRISHYKQKLREKPGCRVNNCWPLGTPAGRPAVGG